MSNFLNEIKSWPKNEKRAFALCSLAVASADGVMSTKEKEFLYKTHTELLGFGPSEISELTDAMKNANPLQETIEILKTMPDRKLENMAYMLIYLAKVDGQVHKNEVDLIMSFLLAAGYPDTVANKIMDEGLKNIEGPRGTINNVSSSEGCYIATAVYGSYQHPSVLILRKFRDQYLKQKVFGRAFIKIYYYFSPKITSIFHGKNKINSISKKILNKVVMFLINKGY